MNSSKQIKQRTIWSSRPVVILTAVFCGCLWGSAFPCVKLGYALFNVSEGDTASQLLFAGVRFFLAGIMVIIFGSLMEHKLMLPSRQAAIPVINLALWQTIIQYIFFYIGIAHASAMRSSILNACQTFITILLSVFLFRYEKLTMRKVIGSIMGFSGVVLIETLGQTLEFGFTWNGEGFVLMTCFAASMANCLIKRYSADNDPVMLTGYQFTLGGAVLIFASLKMGGSLSMGDPAGLILILYMAFISSAGYTLWSLLLRNNPVSKVSMFTFITPVAGVSISTLLLGEHGGFNMYIPISLLLVCSGIWVVFWEGRKKRK